MQELALIKTSWKEIKDNVYKVNSSFAKSVDELNRKNDLPLYLARYPFGSTIIKAEQFYLPLKTGGSRPIAGSKLSPSLQTKLSYTGSIPMGIVLNNTVELFLEKEHGTIPFNLMAPGKIFALWGALNGSKRYLAPRLWNITAGARSIVVLPKITDMTGYKKLCRARNIKMTSPKDLFSHASLLTQISQHNDLTKEWYSELLFFPIEWLKEKDDNTWIKFHNFLHCSAWEMTEYWRNKVAYDQFIDFFANKETDQKTSSFIIDILKHLIMISLGVVPGFVPATNNKSAPIQVFQKDFVELYKLRKYVPTIMVPHHFNLAEKRPVYWSLQFPTHFEPFTNQKRIINTLTILREIQNVVKKFITFVLKSNDDAGNTLRNLVKQVRFDFFHSESDPTGQIKASSEMPNDDKTLITCMLKSGGQKFSDISPFIRGCVRISAK